MAEAFGIFAGAASLVDLFMPCAECFEYVQFGRRFGPDYERSLVKLDVVRLRLSRWGVSVGIVADSRESRTSIPTSQGGASDAEVEMVKSTLGQITDAFEEAQATSMVFKTKAEKSKSTDLVLYDPDKDLEPRFRSLHLKTRSAALRRQRETNLLQEAGWALYEKKKFDRLIEDVTGLVDTLEQQFPEVQKRQEALRQQDISDIGDTDALRLLRDVAGNDDERLTAAVTKALAARGTQYRNFEISGEETAKAHVGKRYAAGESHGEQGDTFEGFKISGRGSTHVGNEYGNIRASNVGRTIFNNYGSVGNQAANQHIGGDMRFH